MTDEPSHTPVQKAKRNLLPNWAFIAVLLGAGTVPCPECGVPLAWHMLPLIGLIAVAQGIARRARLNRRKNDPPPESGEVQRD